MLALCDVDPRRLNAVATTNFPDACVIDGDLSSPEFQLRYVTEIRTRLDLIGAQEPFVISCTPPCQGMSKSGQGTLLKNIREGKRPTGSP